MSFAPIMSAPISTSVMGCSGPVLVGPESTQTTCPFCQASVRTLVQYTNNSCTHIAAAIWGRICCCVCIPYMSNSAKNSDHYCPRCERYIGTYRK